MDVDLDFAVRLAQQAGEYLETQYRSAETSIGLKPDRSVVTQADVAADRMIRTAIQARYPDDLYLSEELQPGLMDGHKEQLPAIWVVDPLDGTTNFSLGLPIWGTLITRLVDGWPYLAVMYFPMLGEFFTAQLGKGAFLNGEKIWIDPQKSRPPVSFFACCSRTFRNYRVGVPFKPRILGSAAYNLCCVARSIAILSFEATPKIWDIAGAWLFLQEAGGYIRAFDGNQIFPVTGSGDFAKQDFPVIAGLTPELVERWRGEIQPISNG
jgi:myo-inositol-1(or 4)-monophosphatase